MYEWYYWHILRRAQKFIPWVARKLPSKLKYYVVIDGMSNVFAQPNFEGHPDAISAAMILKRWSPDKKD